MYHELVWLYISLARFTFWTVEDAKSGVHQNTYLVYCRLGACLLRWIGYRDVDLGYCACCDIDLVIGWTVLRWCCVVFAWFYAEGRGPGRWEEQRIHQLSPWFPGNLTTLLLNRPPTIPTCLRFAWLSPSFLRSTRWCPSAISHLTIVVAWGVGPKAIAGTGKAGGGHGGKTMGGTEMDRFLLGKLMVLAVFSKETHGFCRAAPTLWK